VVACFFLFFLSVLVFFGSNDDLFAMNLPHIKEKNTHYNNNPLAPRLVKIKVRENLYNIKMKEINTKVRKNKRGNLYKK